MKKFNIRTLLLLVISVVTVFAFAACQPKDNGGDSGGKKPAATGITYQSFVDKLFDAAAKGIGGTAVNGANDLALSFDLDITLRLDENKSVPVALSLTAFLDQT
ncbi:MAG: hypothetical protein LBC13_00765, partial [Clostridiales bacterium]|nr:hypothetical protein [Clostridiales bacterium]